MILFRRLLLTAGLAGTVLSASAQAAEIRVLTAGAFRPVLEALVPAFEARSGNKVTVVTDTAGGIANRMARGEAFDIAVLTQAAADGPARNGEIILVTPIASVGVGAAVKVGAPRPDISTTATLKAALLAAPKVAMVDPASGGTSGAYLMKMFDQLGIGDQMKPKLVMTQGGLAAERVANGDAALALAQTSEIMAVKGVVLVGPLPGELQTKTIYVAAMNPKAAEAPLILLAVLAGQETKAILPEKGMGPP